MNTKNNQRFRETETRMEVAMLELMENTDFNKITVKKICEQAKVNRSTFYAHFTDINDILTKMDKYLNNEVIESYREEKEIRIFSAQSFIRFLDHIKKHRAFYKISFQNGRKLPLEENYEKLWELIEPLCRNAGITDMEQITYYFTFFRASFISILKHWMDTDCKISTEEMADIIHCCIPNVLV